YASPDVQKKFEAAYKKYKNDPVKYIKAIEAAGYAGDPKTYAQRAKNNFSSYSDFVMATPEYKSALTPTPRSKIARAPMVKSIQAPVKPQMTVTPTPTVRSPFVQKTASVKATSKAPLANSPLRSQVQSADVNRNGRVDWGESTVGRAVNNVASRAVSAVKNVFSPRVISPIPQQKAPAPRPVAKPPAPAPKQNIIQKAASSVKNLLGRFKFW
ncbi:MAG TPA: hypothetical protein VEA37_06255, partial [Flavobacterium sp.]|nr:hypothetical protein [Flavobacterium sp.]